MLGRASALQGSNRPVIDAGVPLGTTGIPGLPEDYVVRGHAEPQA